MTMPKKGRRKITVDGELYYWKTRINKQRIKHPSADAFQIDVTIVIEHSQYPSSDLIVSFIGKELWAYGVISGVQTISITPSVVRSVIQYALNNGWKPQKNKQNVVIKNAEQYFPQAVLSEIEDGWDDYIQSLKEYYLSLNTEH